MSILRNNNPDHSGRLGNSGRIVIWAGFLVILEITLAVLSSWRNRQITDLTILIMSITLILMVISNPMLVGFIFVYFDSKKQKLAIRDGALHGAFTAFFIKGLGTIMLILQDLPGSHIEDYILYEVNIILPGIFQSFVLGAIAGSVAVLLRNKDSEKRIKIEEGTKNAGLSSVINERNDQLEVMGLRKSEWEAVYIYLPYIFIILGATLTISLVINYGSWVTLITPWVFFLIGPSIQALITSYLLEKLYNDPLTKHAVFVASVVFLVCSVGIIVYILPLMKTTMNAGLLWLFLIPLVSLGHIFTLVALFLPKWVDNLLNKW